jgi:tRNA A-37 threonylcarbamoyl transferase component Bud32
MTDPRRCGSYELLELIGRGGMGEVWRARHTALGRHAAVKRIRPELAVESGEDAATVLRRFQREVQATSALRSPHTVAVYDYGTADDGAFYYAMELLEGRDLRTLVEDHGPLAPERAVHFLLQACDSLAEAHVAGLVHRDVKPANLFACKLGLQHDFLKVLDFGLVKPAAGSGLLETQLTVGAAAMGSPAFMPPEIAEGRGTVDARSDVYSLGCVAYWLLTGKLLFEADTAMRMLMDHVGKTPEPPSKRAGAALPAALDDVVLRCLHKAPDERPQNARELAALLRKVPFAQPWNDTRAEAWWIAMEARRTAAAAEPTVALASAKPPAAAAPPSKPAGAPFLPPPGASFLPPPVVSKPAAALAPPAASSSPPERPPPKKVVVEHRERTIAALQAQFVESHIDANELSRRIMVAERAVTPSEMDRLLEDLPYLPGEVPKEKAIVPPPVAAAAPVPDAQPTAQSSQLPAPTLAPVDVPVEKSRSFIAIFGGRSKAGKWYPPKKLRVVSVFGGVELDLRHAEFQPGVTTIDVVAMFGGCSIYLPKGMYVDINGTGIFGGFDESASTEGRPPQGYTPWVRIRGAAMFGGVEVKSAGKDEDLGKPGGIRHPQLPGRRMRRRDRGE